MIFNVIAQDKCTKKWLICKIDGRTESKELTELAEDKDFMSFYEKMELESQYFVYYKLKGI